MTASGGMPWKYGPNRIGSELALIWKKKCKEI